MARMRLARKDKKKTPSSKGSAFGCGLAIVLLLVLFIWAFSGALRP